MGAEDFSFMLQAKPGAYLRLGQGLESGMGGCYLHNSGYDFNVEVLPLGAALHAGLVVQGMPLPEGHANAESHVSTISNPARSDA
jgi:hippurate hydrolase